MQTRFFKFISLLGLFFALAACQEGSDVVESGTYQGEVIEVEADKDEIYVKTADGKTLELYFTEKTTLTQADAEVPFATLKEGQQVEVTVERVGKRLDPVSVKILE